MTDPTPPGAAHEPESPLPDPAAVDELLRAFGIDPPDDGVNRPTEQIDEVVVKRLTDEAAASAERGSADLAALVTGPDPTPPDPTPKSLADADASPPADDAPVAKVIRIDDFVGSSTIEQPPAAADAPQGAPDDVPAGSADRRTVAIGGDDDEALPDAVYVSGSLSADDSARVVVIADDGDDTDAIAVEDAAAARRTVEPKLRQRRVAVGRAAGLRRLRWVFAGLGVLIVGLLALTLLGSKWFAVQHVDVVGRVYSDGPAFDAVVDSISGTPTLRVDTVAAEAQLEKIPWVAAARVRTDFPTAVVIEIKEREPIATYQSTDQRYRVLDREGRVLDVIDGYPFAYVLIVGPDPVDLDAGMFVPAGYRAAAELAKILTPTVRSHTDRIEVTADGSRLALWLHDGSEVYFGEARDLFVKLVRLETRLTTDEDTEPGLIDISTADTTR